MDIDSATNSPDNENKGDKEVEEKKEKWGTKIEFILTCLSYVIGFGKQLHLISNLIKSN